MTHDHLRPDGVPKVTPTTTPLAADRLQLVGVPKVTPTTTPLAASGQGSADIEDGCQIVHVAGSNFTT